MDTRDLGPFRMAALGTSRLEKGVFALSCLGDGYVIRSMIERDNARVLALNRSLTPRAGSDVGWRAPSGSAALRPGSQDDTGHDAARVRAWAVNAVP